MSGRDYQSRQDRDAGNGYGGYGGYDYGSSNGYGSGSREVETEVGGGYGGGGGGYGAYDGGYGRSGDGYGADGGQDAYGGRSQDRGLGPDGYSHGNGVNRERSRDRRDRSRDRSRERSREPSDTRVRGQSGNRGYGPGTGQLDDVLRAVEKNWDFMTEDTCVPVKVALSLMDTSSLGRAHRLDDFLSTNRELQYALQAIVNDHHQGFNSSIGTFHSIMRSITTSQSKVRELRESLIKAKADLSVSKPEVKHMVESTQKYEAMLQTISTIERLQLVPDNLDARISEKKFLSAVEILSEGLKMISQPDMMEIGALSDLRAYLGSQEASLADILVEELHNHLYLKSLYCADRWKPYSSTQKDGTSSAEGAPSQDVSLEGGRRALHAFIETSDFSQIMVEDANTTNPEADSLYYIRLILEALQNLGHLSNAVSLVNQRLPVELFKLVDKTNNEVDQRHPSSFPSVSRAKGPGRAIDLGLGENDVRATVIQDLLWTLYSKFEAVMEGHRIIYDVLKGIGRRDGSEEVAFLATGFLEVWQLIQSEMRSLLHDYLTKTENRSLHSAAPKGLHSAINNIATGRLPRDKDKMLFQLSGTDSASPAIKGEQEDLEQILKSSVPGLVSESLRPAVASQDTNASHDGSATGHKLLIEPSVFNIGLLLPPSIAFLKRVKEIVPPGSGIVISALPSFLDDFLVNVFHPSLEDTLHELFSQTVGDVDAFHPDPDWALVAKKPVTKGTTAFFELITAFCKMLDSITPDQALGELTIDLLRSFYDKCQDWYKELVHDSGAGATTKISAQWARNDLIRTVLADIWMDKTYSDELLKQETEIELKARGNTKLAESDLIVNRKTVSSLCLLSSSLKWLSGKIVQLRRVEEQVSAASEDRTHPGRLRRRWTLVESARAQQDSYRNSYLPMTTDTVGAFDGIVASFQNLATTVLYTVRLEARAHCMHYIERTLSDGNYCLDNVVHTPDTAVLTLNTHLTWYEEEVASVLPARDARFAVRGLGALIDGLLVAKAANIKIINTLGVQRMNLNILILQQTLKNLDPAADLERAKRFYALYIEGVENVIARTKEGKLDFTYDELKTFAELFFSEAMSNRRESGSAHQARRSLNENLLALSEAMWTLE